jgi:hypothetical protein
MQFSDHQREMIVLDSNRCVSVLSTCMNDG